MRASITAGGARPAAAFNMEDFTMQVAADMLRTHPHPGLAIDALSECITACGDCAQACAACADACLGEETVQHLTRCIRLNLDCADVCHALENMLSRQTHRAQHLLAAQIDTCRMACELCAEECERHQDEHEHCRVCAQACRNCQQSCDRLLSDFR